MRNTENANNVETRFIVSNRKDVINHISTKRPPAFTLVELIIVITILAILATIGFMSFQTYTIDARDANRITSLKTMSDGLQIYQAKKSIFPDPDEQTVNIMSGTLTVSIQGYAGASVLQKLRASDIKDPSDKSYYTYIVNSDKTKYQLLGMLEKDANLVVLNQGLVNETYARTDYTARYGYTTGNKVGIFFSGTTNIPLQETMSGNLVLTDTTNSAKIFKVMFSNQTTNSGTIALSGVSLPAQIQTITNTTATTVSTSTTPVVTQWKDIAGTNCTNTDITIGTQTWAGCNSVLGNGLTYNANNYCRNYAGTNLGGTACYGDITKENAYDSTNGEDNIWGKLYLWSTLSTECKNPTGGNFTNTTTSTTNCACPTGWHIPTQQDFLTLEQNLTCSDYTTDLSWRCTGLGWSGKSSKNATNNIIKALKLPLAGYRSSGTFYNRGNSAYLWSSTEYDSTNARGRFFYRSQAGVYSNYRDKTTNGFSVRCIKDL